MGEPLPLRRLPNAGPVAPRDLRYLSVCSGIEAASVAWEPLGWTPVAFSEIGRFPSKVLATRWPHVPNLGDFTTIDPGGLGPVDLLVGGTPCQAFSVAGKRGSLADARGNLSLAFVDLAHGLADAAGTRWAVWENVPGVLSTPDNAFGCFLGRLVGSDGPVVPPGAKGWGPAAHFDAGSYDVHRTYRWQSCGWPRQGMVSGPRARAAWRVLDAQYFGLAQRRERVFVVVGLADGANPAAVLFEPQGLRRHPPTRGEAGQGVARPLAQSVALRGREGGSAIELGGDVGFTLRASKGGGDKPHVLAFGGNDTRGPIDVSTAINAHGGPCGRQDFESETFVVAPPLTSNPYGDHESREGHLVACDVADTLTVGANQTTGYIGDVIAHSLRAEGFDASEDGTGRGTPIVPICFDCKAGGDTSFSIGAIPGALRGAGHGGGHAAVAFGIRSDALREGIAKTPSLDSNGIARLRNPGMGITEELAPTVDCGAAHAVATGWAVRRLTPTECHRLQGFPDNHAAIDGAADGPIYMALGNSKAVPVVRWLGARIAAVDAEIINARIMGQP